MSSMPGTNRKKIQWHLTACAAPGPVPLGSSHREHIPRCLGEQMSAQLGLCGACFGKAASWWHPHQHLLLARDLPASLGRQDKSANRTCCLSWVHTTPVDPCWHAHAPLTPLPHFGVGKSPQSKPIDRTGFLVAAGENS